MSTDDADQIKREDEELERKFRELEKLFEEQQRRHDFRDEEDEDEEDYDVHRFVEMYVEQQSCAAKKETDSYYEKKKLKYFQNYARHVEMASNAFFSE